MRSWAAYVISLGPHGTGGETGHMDERSGSPAARESLEGKTTTGGPGGRTSQSCGGRRMRMIFLRFSLSILFVLSISLPLAHAQANPSPVLSIPNIPRFHRVAEGLYRGAQPAEDGFQALQAMGIKTIVNFRRGQTIFANEALKDSLEGWAKEQDRHRILRRTDRPFDPGWRVQPSGSRALPGEYSEAASGCHRKVLAESSHFVGGDHSSPWRIGHPVTIS